MCSVYTHIHTRSHRNTVYKDQRPPGTTNRLVCLDSSRLADLLILTDRYLLSTRTNYCSSLPLCHSSRSSTQPPPRRVLNPFVVIFTSLFVSFVFIIMIFFFIRVKSYLANLLTTRRRYYTNKNSFL